MYDPVTFPKNNKTKQLLVVLNRFVGIRNNTTGNRTKDTLSTRTGFVIDRLGSCLQPSISSLVHFLGYLDLIPPARPEPREEVGRVSTEDVRSTDPYKGGGVFGSEFCSVLCPKL